MHSFTDFSTCISTEIKYCTVRLIHTYVTDMSALDIGNGACMQSGNLAKSEQAQSIRMESWVAGNLMVGSNAKYIASDYKESKV